MEVTKIAATLFLLGAAIAAWAIWYDEENRTTTHHSDGGWTRHYTVPKSVRQKTRAAGFVSALIFMADVLFIIWTF